MENVSRFSRTLANEGKLGAYYTDLGQCTSIRELFEFPEEMLVLEPSAGDASAVCMVTNKQEDDGTHIFAVEINSDAAKNLKQNPLVEEVLCEDFLNGVRISNHVFSFCFANPPYGEGGYGIDGKRHRLESQFVDKIYNYMAPGGVVCFVIPEYVLKDEAFQRVLLAKYQAIGTCRFRKPVYDQFKQIVFIGIVKRKVGWRKEEMEDFIQRLQEMQDLPEHYTGKKLRVPTSNIESLKMFTSAEFHPEDVYTSLANSALRKREEILKPKEFGNSVGHPPIKLKKNLLYLLAVSGSGQGLVGDEKAGTLHLQRGVAKRVDSSSVSDDDSKNTGVMTVTTTTKIVMTTIEADGTIKKLS